MDAEEARKALDLARKHDMNGNTEAALKWARKSVAIYSTPEAMALFTRLKQQGAQGSSDTQATSESASKPKVEETLYTESTSRTTVTDDTGKQREYTEKQIDIVRRVKRAGGDFYAVLGIQKTAEEGEIKKSYKKVSKAFTILSDKDKRAMYDRFGGDPDSRFGSAAASSAAHPFAGGARMRPGMATEMDPEDLFNMFFGGGAGMAGAQFGGPMFTFGGPGFRTHYYRPGAGARARQAGQQPAGGANQTAMWFQLLPIIILVFFTLLSYIPQLFTVSDPDFRWRPTSLHRAQRTTMDRGISYYVDPVSFAKHPFVTSSTTSKKQGGNVQRFSKDRGSPELRAFEQRVEEMWMKELYRQCENALEYKRRRLLDAQGFFGFGGDREKIAKIQAEVYESCEQLERLYGLRVR
ncbi:Chaperone protein dnaJ [Malassezia caprae]|uniref:Chaperone protein dnaJ n=1 Tax=Malassezia caprae TaxID=1381934 RepID=A0AAF0EDX6_9BASI|nr:Chaperone protein dnaJ [Malassezia caprae]